MEVKIYVLRNPEDLEIRYIGRTKNPLKIRLSGHLNKARRNKFKTHKDNWILSLEIKPIIELIEIVIGWEESYKREQQLIKEYIKKGYRLTNLHDRGTRGLLRDISEEQKLKISKKVKQLHKEGKLHCGRKSVDVYDLEGNFINNFDSYKKASEFIGIRQKQFQSSMRRNDKRIKNYQVKLKGENPPQKWKQRTGELPKNFKKLYIWDVLEKKLIEFEAVKKFKEYFKTGASTVNYYVNINKLFKGRFLITNARLKLDELLESLEVGNQQPRLGSINMYQEVSTTNE
jgi:hypothetical protein